MWLMTDQAQLEKEARERLKLADLAQQSEDRWKAGKVTYDEEKNKLSDRLG